MKYQQVTNGGYYKLSHVGTSGFYKWLVFGGKTFGYQGQLESGLDITLAELRVTTFRCLRKQWDANYHTNVTELIPSQGPAFGKLNSIIIRDHRYLEPAAAVVEGKVSKVPADWENLPRADRKGLLELEAKGIRETIAKHETKLAKAKHRLGRLEKQIERLGRFDTDEEEFAHFLGEAIKSEGDPIKIIAALKDSGMMKVMSVAKAQQQALEDLDDEDDSALSSPKRFAGIDLD